MALLQYNLLFMIVLLACSSVHVFGMDKDKLKKPQSTILNANAAPFVPHNMLPKSSFSSAAASPTHQTHQMPVSEPSSPVQQHGQEVDSKSTTNISRQQPFSSPAWVFEEPQYDNIQLIINKAKESRFLPRFKKSQDNEGESEIQQQKGDKGEPSNVVGIVSNSRQNAPHQQKELEEPQSINKGNLVTTRVGKDKEATEFGPIVREQDQQKYENAKDKTTEHAVMESLSVMESSLLNKNPEPGKSHPISVGKNVQNEPTEPQMTEPLENFPKSPEKEFDKMVDQNEEIVVQIASHEDARLDKKKENMSGKVVQRRKKGKLLRKQKPKFVAKQKVESDDSQNKGKSEGEDMSKNTEEAIDVPTFQMAPEKSRPAEAAVAQGSSSIVVIGNSGQKVRDQASAVNANLLTQLKDEDNLSVASATSSDVINDGDQRHELTENVAVEKSHQESTGNVAVKTSNQESTRNFAVKLSHHDGKINPQVAAGTAAGDAVIRGQQKLAKELEELQLSDRGGETEKASKAAVEVASSTFTSEALSPPNSQKQQQKQSLSNKEREKEAVDAILVEANELKILMDNFVEVENDVAKDDILQCFHRLINQLYTYWLQNAHVEETRKPSVYTTGILGWLSVIHPERKAELESALFHVGIFFQRYSNLLFDFDGFTTAMQKLQGIVNDVQALFQNENGFKIPKMQSQYTEMTKCFELEVRPFLVAACSLNLVVSNIGQPFAEDRMLTDLSAVFHLFRLHQKEKLEDSNAYHNQLKILRDYLMLEGGSKQKYMHGLAKALGLSPDEVVGVATQPHELEKKIGLTGIFKDGVNIVEKIQKEWEKQQKTAANVESQSKCQKGKGKAKSEVRGGHSKSAKGKGKGIVIQEVPADCSPEQADQFSAGLRWKQLADELSAKKMMKRLEQLRQLILTTNTLIHIQGREDAALQSGQDTSLFSQIWAWTYRDRYQHTTDKWIQKKALVDPLLNLGIVVEDKINKRKLKNLIEEMRHKARIHHFKKRWSAAMNRLHYEQSVANDDDDDAADDQAQISDDDNVQLGKTVFRLISPNYNYIHMIKAQVVQWTDETQTKMLRRCNGSFFYPSNGSGQFSIVWSKCKLEEPREYVSVCASFAESHSKEQQAGVRYPLKSICADFWKADNVKVVNDIYEGNVLIHIDYNHSKTAKLIMKVRKID